MKIIAVAIQKGGSGKTTTTLNLSAALRDMGKRCLLIDMDPQTNLSHSLGIHDEPAPNIYHLLKQEAFGQKPVVESAMIEREGMDLIPASLELAGAELELASVYGREKVMAQLLKKLKRSYDFIFIDCPPSIGMLTVNALVASDYILLPLQAEFLSLKGVHGFLRHLELVKRLDKTVKVLGFVLTKFDYRKNMNQNVKAQLIEDYGPEKMFESHIRTNIALANAQENGVDIFSFDKRANGALDYQALAVEFLAKIK